MSSYAIVAAVVGLAAVQSASGLLPHSSQAAGRRSLSVCYRHPEFGRDEDDFYSDTASRVPFMRMGRQEGGARRQYERAGGTTAASYDYQQAKQNYYTYQASKTVDHPSQRPFYMGQPRAASSLEQRQAELQRQHEELLRQELEVRPGQTDVKPRKQQRPPGSAFGFQTVREQQQSQRNEQVRWRGVYTYHYQPPQYPNQYQYMQNQLRRRQQQQQQQHDSGRRTAHSATASTSTTTGYQTPHQRQQQALYEQEQRERARLRKQQQQQQQQQTSHRQPQQPPPSSPYDSYRSHQAQFERDQSLSSQQRARQRKNQPQEEEQPLPPPPSPQSNGRHRVVEDRRAPYEKPPEPWYKQQANYRGYQANPKYSGYSRPQREQEVVPESYDYEEQRSREEPWYKQQRVQYSEQQQQQRRQGAKYEEDDEEQRFHGQPHHEWTSWFPKGPFWQNSNHAGNPSKDPFHNHHGPQTESKEQPPGPPFGASTRTYEPMRGPSPVGEESIPPPPPQQQRQYQTHHQQQRQQTNSRTHEQQQGHSPDVQKADDDTSYHQPRKMYEHFKPAVVSGDSLKTWSLTSEKIEMAEVLLKTAGLPLDADVEVWNGPDSSPCRMRIYTPDGNARPFRAVLPTPNGPNTIAVKNVAPQMHPLAAMVAKNPEEHGQQLVDKPQYKSMSVSGGGAVKTHEIAEEKSTRVESVQVLLRSADGGSWPVNARVELVQELKVDGKSTEEVVQILDVFCEDGSERPFYVIVETPRGEGAEAGSNAIRITNNNSDSTQKLEAWVEPYVVGYGVGVENALDVTGTATVVDVEVVED